MAFNDIYIVRDKQAFLGQELLNVYYYRMTVTGTGTPPPAEQLAAAFDNFVIAPMLQLQHVTLQHQLVTVINLNDVLDFEERVPTAAAGLVALEPAPSFVALSYRSSRDAPGQRYSYKRIGGIGEDVIDGNSMEGSYVTYSNTLAGRFGLILVGSGGAQFEPVQVRKPIIYGANPAVNRPLVGATYWSFRGLASQASRNPSS